MVKPLQRITCWVRDATGSKSGHDASQKLMAPLSCPVMYKFLAVENELKLVEFELFPSFCLLSNGKSGRLFFASTMKSYITITWKTIYWSTMIWSCQNMIVISDLMSTSSPEYGIHGLFVTSLDTVILESENGSFTITSFGSDGDDFVWLCIRYLSIKLSSYA